MARRVGEGTFVRGPTREQREMMSSAAEESRQTRGAPSRLAGDELRSCRSSWARRAQDRLACRERERQRAREAVGAVLPGLLAQFGTVEVAYLYGSVLREGEFSASSDVDVAVAGADTGTCLRIWREAERVITEWPLDVRPLDDSDFADRVRGSGEVIYARACTGAEG